MSAQARSEHKRSDYPGAVHSRLASGIALRVERRTIPLLTQRTSITHSGSSARTQTTRRASHYGEVSEVVVWVVVVCAGVTVTTGGASPTVGCDRCYCVERCFSPE